MVGPRFPIEDAAVVFYTLSAIGCFVALVYGVAFTAPYVNKGLEATDRVLTDKASAWILSLFCVAMISVLIFLGFHK